LTADATAVHAPHTASAQVELPIKPAIQEERLPERAPDELAVPPMRAPEPPPMPRNMPELPPVSLTLPPGSALELVETTHKLEPTEQAEHEAPRPRRARPPRPTIVEEPLQLVETRKETPPAT
jgi:hypothetical protein